MKRDNVNYLAVGIFVLMMIGAFFALMYFVTGRTGPADNYTVRYKNVSGLKFGTGVFYEGYRVGQVEKIEPAPATTGMQYSLTVSVSQGWKIPADSVARVVSSGLISALQIEIDEGQSPDNIEPGGEIEGEEQANIFAVLSSAAGQLDSLSENGVVPLLANLNGRIDEISTEILAFRRDQLQPLVDSLNLRINHDLIGDAQQLIEKLDDSATNLRTITGSANQREIAEFLVHIDEAAVDFGAVITRIETTRLQMGETLLALRELATDNGKEVAVAIKSASASMEELQAMLTTVNEHIGTIMYNVDGGARQLHEFTRAIRDNPARIVRGTEARDEP